MNSKSKSLLFLFITVTCSLFSFAGNAQNDYSTNTIYYTTITLPVIEIRARSTEEKNVLEYLANNCGVNYPFLLYIDRILDNIQNKYKIPASVIWAIIWYEYEMPNSSTYKYIPNILKQELESKPYQYHENYQYKSTWDIIENFAQNIYYNRDRANSSFDYNYWVELIANKFGYNEDRLIPVKRVESERLDHIKNIIKEYKLHVLNR